MTDEVRQAADRLVAAFASGDLQAYFGCFADDATFVFHTTDRVLRSTEEYRRLWAQWVQDDDFAVVACSTADTHVQDLGTSAVLTHRVRTTVSTRAGQETLDERETIVFARDPSGRWVGVHEHLSPYPTA